MITECQKQQKQEGQKKRRLRGKQETSVETWEMHLQDHVSEIIKGPQGGSGSDKFRITTIMCQRIRHWFSEDKDPVGEIMPTVAIFFGAEGYLEDIGDDGTFCSGPHEGSKAPVQLMHEWRNLRKQGLLPGCQVSTAGLSEIYIWQQENAYSTGANMQRFHSLLRLWCERRPMLGICDSWRGHFSAEVKQSAAANNMIQVPVGKGTTMPAQLTDAELAFPCKATEAPTKATILREKKQLGQKASFNRVDMYRLVMAQHSKAKMMNETDKVVLLGARRIGLLARRPTADGDFQNLDEAMPSWSRATWKDKR